MEEIKTTPINRNVKWVLVLLRIAIGWHFLFEGLSKLFTPGWTSADYLETSRWIFAPVFHWVAETPSILMTVDVINIWALILISSGFDVPSYWVFPGNRNPGYCREKEMMDA